MPFSDMIVCSFWTGLGVYHGLGRKALGQVRRTMSSSRANLQGSGSSTSHLSAKCLPSFLHSFIASIRFEDHTKAAISAVDRILASLCVVDPTAAITTNQNPRCRARAILSISLLKLLLLAA